MPFVLYRGYVMGKDVEVLERLGLSKEVIKRYKERTKELEKEAKRESKIQFTESELTLL